MSLQPRPSDPGAAAHERVYRSLRTRIMHGELPPGSALTLRGIGKSYDVSMTPAREAVRRLVAEGAVSLSSSGRVSTPEFSNERIEELASLRAMLEPELASRALPRAHFALIERLEAINNGVSQMVARHDATGYIRMNLEFHRPSLRLRLSPGCRNDEQHDLSRSAHAKDFWRDGELKCARSEAGELEELDRHRSRRKVGLLHRAQGAHRRRRRKQACCVQTKRQQKSDIYTTCQFWPRGCYVYMLAPARHLIRLLR